MKKTVKVLAIITMLGLFCSCGAEKIWQILHRCNQNCHR